MADHLGHAGRSGGEGGGQADHAAPAAPAHADLRLGAGDRLCHDDGGAGNRVRRSACPCCMIARRCSCVCRTATSATATRSRSSTRPSPGAVRSAHRWACDGALLAEADEGLGPASRLGLSWSAPTPSAHSASRRRPTGPSRQWITRHRLRPAQYRHRRADRLSFAVHGAAMSYIDWKPAPSDGLPPRSRSPWRFFPLAVVLPWASSSR